MSTNQTQKITLILSFLALAAAAITVKTTPLPDGPWEGIYQIYAPTWFFLLAGAILMAWGVTRGMSWRILTLFGVVFVAVVVSLSLQWGYVYGFHDPWTHYYYLKFGVLDFAQNPYPGFHAGVLVIADTLGLKGTTVLQYMALLASLIGVLGLAILLRRLSFSTTASQLTFIAGLPTLFMGFTARPFTLVWPIVAFIAWVIFTSLNRRRAIIVLLSFGGLFVMIHPQLPFFASTFFLAGLVTVLLRPYIPKSYKGDPLSFDVRNFAGLIGSYAVLVGGYLLLFTGAGPKIVDRIGDRFGDILSQSPAEDGAQTPVSTPSETPAATEPSGETPAATEPDSPNLPTPSGTETGGRSSLIVRVINNPSALTEVVSRLTYIILLGILSVVSVFEKLWKRDFDPRVFVFFIAAIQFGVFFLFVDLVLNSAVINTRRGVKMLPLVLVPSIVYALRARMAGRHVVGGILAIAVLTGGLAVAYPSDYTGGIAKTATDEQVEGIRWIEEYNPKNGPVTGGGMTFWVARGLFGPEIIEGWATTDEYSPTRIAVRRDGYQWQVRDPNGLIVVDSVSRASAEHEAQEAGTETVALRDLKTMPIRHSSIYDNEGTTIYKNDSTRNN